MSTPYLGEIRAVGFNFPPVDWATCNGQLLNISEYEALYTLLGTTYGGDGISTFGVPDMRSRVGVGSQNNSAGGGLSSYPLGAVGGQEAVTLTSAQLPTHMHSFLGSLGGSTTGTLSDDPAGRRPGAPTGASTYASSSQAGKNLAANAVTGNTTAAGGNQPHNNIQPVLALNFIIATAGLYPPKPQ